MPYTIKKEGNKFCVYNSDTDEKRGCSDSRFDAEAQMRALYAAEGENAIMNAIFTKEELAVMRQFNGEHDDDHHDWIPKPGLPAEHAEMMAGLAKSLKHISKMIFKMHFEEAPLTPVSQVDKMMAPVAAPAPSYKTYDEYMSELVASGEEIVEHAWEGPIAFEGAFTGDKRYFHPGSITWDPEALPLTFRWQKSSVPGHTGAVPIGRVDKIERQDDGVIYGWGVIIPSLNDEAAEYLRLIESGVASGVSVDGDSAVFDVRELSDGTSSVEFSSMRIRSLTAVDIPAFSDAQVDLADTEEEDKKGDEETTEEDTEEEVGNEEEENEELARKRRKKSMRWVYNLTASAGIPTKPPVMWFEEPTFDEPTPITVTSQGEVFGHLALFDTCHIGFPGSCVSPPRNGTYQYFHTGEIETETGECVEVGHLTFNTGHAAMTDNAKAAAAHYDHTGLVAADVRVGEDKHGIWVTGALRSNLSDEDIRAFRAAPLSGDWRRIAGRLELVGALAVNVPGFPVPRVRTLVASGETETLLTFQEAEKVVNQEKKTELAQRLGILPSEADVTEEITEATAEIEQVIDETVTIAEEVIEEDKEKEVANA